MDININSPAYYSSIYGVNDAVYNLCKDIRLFVKDKSYSDKVNIIGICPIVAPESEINKWKEEVKYDFKYSMVTIWKRIDYNSFVSSVVSAGSCTSISFTSSLTGVSAL